MNILLYKPSSYDPDQCAMDINNFYPDEDIIKDAINSFFLGKGPLGFRWLETIRREHTRRECYGDHSPAYWFLSNPKKVFKTLTVVSTE